MKKTLPLISALLSIAFINVQRAQAQNGSPYWSLAGNSNASASSKLGTTNSVPVNIVTNNATRLTVSTAGNVGIGTTSPVAKLHIVDQVNTGSGYYKPLRLYNPALATGEHVQLAIGRANSTYNQGEINFNLAGGVGSINNTLSLGLYGQPTILTLQGTGNVGIGTTTPAAKLDVVDTSTVDGAKAISGTSIGFSGSGVYGEGLYGVWGNGMIGVLADGEVGIISTGEGDDGVRGSSNSTNGVAGYGTDVGANGVYGSGGSGGYAGYFDGNVYTTGSYLPSDRTLKQHIADLASAMAIISKLQPKQYEYRQDGNYKLMHLPEGQRYGLIAQDVAQVLPGLVKANQFQTRWALPHKPGAKNNPASQANETISFQAVNYTELIPILVKALQEQQQENNDLKARVSKLEEMVSRFSNGSNLNTSGTLSQATPNPTSSSTRIAYTLPQGTGHAQLLLTDAAGKMIKSFSLNSSGKVDVNTAALSSGVYNYSLYVDGKVMDTKKLVVAR